MNVTFFSGVKVIKVGFNSSMTGVFIKEGNLDWMQKDGHVRTGRRETGVSLMQVKERPAPGAEGNKGGRSPGPGRERGPAGFSIAGFGPLELGKEKFLLSWAA